MLSPNRRSLYTAAMTPPPDMDFAEAIGTTFSLDPLMVFVTAVHEARFDGGGGEALRDGIALYESLKRLSRRITIYVQGGRIQVPPSLHPLYGLLDSMIVEVKAPEGGLFHPKLWIMRFTGRMEPQTNLLRLMILTRNLTMDHSWDIALTLEGRPSLKAIPDNQDLSAFIKGLPEMAMRPITDSRIEQARRLGDEILQTEWELPPNFSGVKFHVLGMDRCRWDPIRSKRFVVISPFCSDEAVTMLVKKTEHAEALISRSETLAELSESTRKRFSKCFTLADAAETEDGEALDEAGSHDTFGLHAKAYIYEQGWYTHVVVGSANATNAAMLNNKNIEILAELTGKRSVNDIGKFLGADGLGELLVEYQNPGSAPDHDWEKEAALKALEAARNVISNSQAMVICHEQPDNDQWRLELQGEVGNLQGIATARVWPITVQEDRAVDFLPIISTGCIELGAFATVTVTGLIAFELRTFRSNFNLRFVLNLRVVGLPSDRESAMLRIIVKNSKDFLRYLLFLLGDQHGDPELFLPQENGGGSSRSSSWSGGLPLLEELVRTYSRDPERLSTVDRAVRTLITDPASQHIVPPEFLALWSIFRSAMEQHDD